MKKKYLFWMLFGAQWVFAQTRGLYVPDGAGVKLAQREKRIALVIGNKSYKNWQLLTNPVNDAHLMASVLSECGFSVTELSDANKDAMIDGIEAFAARISGKETVALFFYAGHGIEAFGKNYLIPTSDNSKCRDDLSVKSIELEYIQRKLSAAAMTILVVDACRNNTLPFTCAGQARDKGKQGFVETQPDGIFIGFSTSPGTTALDGTPQTKNSPYTAALATAIRNSMGEDIESVFKTVRNRVKQQGQIPWQHSGYDGKFFFKPAVVEPPRDKDSDGDGILDRVDNCPNERGLLTNNGCPLRENMALIAAPPALYKMGSIYEASENLGRGAQSVLFTVTLRPFLMDKYETTFAEYDAFCEDTERKKPDDAGFGRGNRPVIHVNWFDACEYANWRSRKAGKTPCYTISSKTIICNWNANGYRLPTEAEWEYAASWNPNTNQKARFGNGKEIADPAEMNFAAGFGIRPLLSRDGENREKTVPVGSFSPNPQGLYDMAGNVSEWCWDWYRDDYSDSNSTLIYGHGNRYGHVIRGGAWMWAPEYCRATNRFLSFHEPTSTDSTLGFRLVAFL